MTTHENIIDLENTLIKQLIANHPIVCTPITDHKTYKQWVSADDAVNEIKAQTGSKKRDIIRAIAVSLNRNGDTIYSSKINASRRSLDDLLTGGTASLAAMGSVVPVIGTVIGALIGVAIAKAVPL